MLESILEVHIKVFSALTKHAGSFVAYLLELTMHKNVHYNVCYTLGMFIRKLDGDDNKLDNGIYD
jgi:hypothetical protein